MLNNINYKRTDDSITYTINLRYDKTLLSKYFSEIPKKDAFDFKKETVHDYVLTEHLDNLGVSIL